jgi:hypothetical protein
MCPVQSHPKLLCVAKQNASKAETMVAQFEIQGQSWMPLSIGAIQTATT